MPAWIKGFRLSSQARALLGILNGKRVYGGPYQAQFGLINSCSLGCIHCYYHSSCIELASLKPVRRAREIGANLPSHNEIREIQRLKADIKTTNKLIDELVKMGTRRFQFSGNGETLQHENALEFMARVKHSKSECWAFTAGHLLNREKIEQIVAMGLNELRITTMAGTNKVYLNTHKGAKADTFDRLKENLLYLADCKKAKRVRQPLLTLINVVTRENHDSMVEFAEFANEVQAERVQFQPIDDAGDPGLAALIPTVDQSELVLAQLEYAKMYLENNDIRHNINYFLNVFNRQLSTLELYRIIPCYHTHLQIMVEPDGSIYPCCQCSVPMGNVFETAISKIWNGEEYRRLRSKALAINRQPEKIDGCACDHCMNLNSNLRVYRILNPIRARRYGLEERFRCTQ